jgi:hypothetical protein
MNDVFGTPFSGRLYEGWAGEPIDRVSGEHDMEFERGRSKITGP